MVISSDELEEDVREGLGRLQNQNIKISAPTPSDHVRDRLFYGFDNEIEEFFPFKADEMTIFAATDGHIIKPIYDGQRPGHLVACKREGGDACFVYRYPTGWNEKLLETLQEQVLPTFKGIFSIQISVAAHLSPRLSVTVLNRSYSLGDIEAQTILPILSNDVGMIMRACLGSGLGSMAIRTKALSSVSINVRIKPFNTDVNDQEGVVTEGEIIYLRGRKQALLKYGISMTAMTCGLNFPEEYQVPYLPCGSCENGRWIGSLHPPHVHRLKLANRVNDTLVRDLPYHIWHGQTEYQGDCVNKIFPTGRTHYPVFTITAYAPEHMYAAKIALAVALTPNYTHHLQASWPRIIDGISLGQLDLETLWPINHRKAFVQASRDSTPASSVTSSSPVTSLCPHFTGSGNDEVVMSETQLGLHPTYRMQPML